MHIVWFLGDIRLKMGALFGLITKCRITKWRSSGQRCSLRIEEGTYKGEQAKLFSESLVVAGASEGDLESKEIQARQKRDNRDQRERVSSTQGARKKTRLGYFLFLRRSILIRYLSWSAPPFAAETSFGQYFRLLEKDELKYLHRRMHLDNGLSTSLLCVCKCSWCRRRSAVRRCAK